MCRSKVIRLQRAWWRKQGDTKATLGRNRVGSNVLRVLRKLPDDAQGQKCGPTHTFYT